MSILHEVLQDIGLAFERPHSFLSFYSYLLNCPAVLCEMLHRYSLGRENISSLIPMMKNDLFLLLYNPPKNILNDFSFNTRFLLISHLTEIFELLAKWTLDEYQYDDEAPSPFYDAVEDGRFALNGSVYGQLKLNETLDRILTDTEIYMILKYESSKYNSRQIELDFSRRKAS